MPNPNATPTPITPPRVPIIDPRTGYIDRAWYLFFLSLNNAAIASTDNFDYGPSSALLPQIVELQKQIDGLQVQPIVDVGAINAAIAALFSAPVTYTANFSVAFTDIWIINNKSGSSCTATLPAASSYSGRVLHFQNYQAQTLVSASSNVVAIGGGAAGTSILLASAGDQSTLVSDGTNWIMMQYVPNNILLLE